MKLHRVKNKKGNIHYYLLLSYKDVNNKSTSKTYKKLGDLWSLMEKLDMNEEQVEEWCSKQNEIETAAYKKENESINLLLSPTKKIELNKQRDYNVGYLILQSLYSQLHLDNTCRRISETTKTKFNLDHILKHLVYGRILNPCSKLSTYKYTDKFVETKSYELHDVYRALNVIADNLDEFQKDMYKNSENLIKRDSSVIYYDCTNYYFEITQEEDKKKYGKSKENRPNPIIQMGLFMDKNGLPLAFNLFDGNQNEQKSMVPLEKKIMQDYELSEFVVCTDAGLGSSDNRKFNNVQNRAFVTTQSLKCIKKDDLAVVLKPEGWRDIKDGKEIKLEKIEDLHSLDEGVYYKELPFTSCKLTQRMIVTYSTKYAKYQQHIRNDQINRALDLMKKPTKLKKKYSNPNDPKRFITQVNQTKDGEVADKIQVALNEEKIMEEAKFDGLYAVCTNLENDVSEIIAVSERRWKIEQCFRVMKTEFKARPVFVRRDDRTAAHFLTCVLALLVIRVLELKLNEEYSIEQIIKTLRGMNMTKIKGIGYIPSFTRTELTDKMLNLTGLELDYEVVKQQQMRKIIKKSKIR